MKPISNLSEASDELKSPDSSCLYRLDMNYLGADYQGFQSQPNGKTVQDHLEKALSVFCRHAVRITAASRTDTGVHAEHQVVTFRSKVDIAPARLVKGLNAMLPKSIRIMNARPVEDSFHPIFNCTGKVYRYTIWRSHGESSFINPISWKLVCDLDLDAMRQATVNLVGRHDFTSFCATDSSAKSKVRTLREIKIVERGPVLELWFLGDGFLKQMVRNLVGSLVAIGRKKISSAQLVDILAAKDRSQAPETAPAEGLCLMSIFYGNNVDIATLLGESTNRYNNYLKSEQI